MEPATALSNSVHLSEQAAGRFVALAGSVPDPTFRVRASDWTVHDVTTHVDISLRAYLGYLKGDTTPVLDPYDLANSNARVLAQAPDRPTADVLASLQADTAELLGLLAERDGDDTVVWHGQVLSVRSLVGLFLGELLLHGADIARSTRRTWSVTADEARTVLEGVFEIAPVFVEPATARGVDAAFDVRVRGGSGHLLSFDDGALTVDPVAPVRPDCHVSAEPVALLRVLYGRSGQWLEIARGRLLAWGRKPWLAFGLTRLFKNP